MWPSFSRHLSPSCGMQLGTSSAPSGWERARKGVNIRRWAPGWAGTRVLYRFLPAQRPLWKSSGNRLTDEQFSCESRDSHPRTMRRTGLGRSHVVLCKKDLSAAHFTLLGFRPESEDKQTSELEPKRNLCWRTWVDRQLSRAIPPPWGQS